MQDLASNEGIVIETSGSWYEIMLSSGSTIMARLQGKMRQEDIKLTNPLAVGDRVSLSNTDKEDSIVIDKILPRKNQILRISPRKKKHYHLIASNIDQALIIISLKHPRTKMGFVNRVLVALEYYNIPAVLVFNKVDIYQNKELDKLIEYENQFEKIGYKTIRTSTKNMYGIEELKELISNKINVFTGASGVGKSTIANLLNPSLQLSTREVSSYNDKGMHTTTFSRMHSLINGGYVIDTPGIKEYGLTEIDAYELSYYFPEMMKRIEHCKFTNCQHINEPKCAVKQAVESSEIAHWRYTSYLSIREELMEENKNY